jgi:hypothetical protein
MALWDQPLSIHLTSASPALAPHSQHLPNPPPSPPSFSHRYIDGKRFETLTKTQTTLARKEMYGAFSVWTKDSNDFGGPAPKDGSSWSWFKDIRRVVCDDIKIDPAFVSPTASTLPASMVSDSVENTKAGNATSKAVSSVTATNTTGAVVASPVASATKSVSNGAASAAAGALAAAAAAAAALML